MAQLSCRSLSVGYDGKTVLHDIDFDINKGDYLCIVGENGTGKSTLMKTLLGLQPPLAGKIIRGYDMKTGGIGYLPQQTGIQRDFPASVREVVMSGCQGRCGIRPFYSRAEKQLVQRAMVKMEITHLSGKCYRELSGGYVQSRGTSQQRRRSDYSYDITRYSCGSQICQPYTEDRRKGVFRKKEAHRNI